MAGVRQFNETEVLASALELFWSKGYSATSMQDLAQATGVLRGSLYNAYGGKEQIFLRAYDRYGQRYLVDARRALDRPSLSQALDSFLAYAVASMTKGRPTRGCLTTKAALDEELSSEEIRAALADLLKRLEALLFERLANPGKGERLRVPAEDAAKLLVTMTRGLVVMERVNQRPAELLRVSKALVGSLVEDGADLGRSATGERRRTPRRA
jgi:AcrR family transcriptional regulator